MLELSVMFRAEGRHRGRCEGDIVDDQRHVHRITRYQRTRAPFRGRNPGEGNGTDIAMRIAGPAPDDVLQSHATHHQLHHPQRVEQTVTDSAVA